MIFSGKHNGKKHFYMVLDGTKTQTRRLSGRYEVESERKNPHKVGYAIQECRTCKGIEGYRIVMDRIRKEDCILYGAALFPIITNISEEDALAEGGYTPEEFEKVFRELNPKWDGWSRWAFEFHVIEVLK